MGSEIKTAKGNLGAWKLWVAPQLEEFDDLY